MTVAVLSPHLDDAVWSLGSSIAMWARERPVRVVTVFAGDPASSDPAGEWDAATGFATAGQAAEARRREDRLACATLGADPVWLPFPDAQYGPSPEEPIWAAILSAVGDSSTVLIPGFPLSHRDHRRLCDLALRRRPRAWRLGLFVEQPYGLTRGLPGAGEPWPRTVADHVVPPRPEPAAADRRARRAKARACRAYGSQIGRLADAHATSERSLVARVRRLEARRGGEPVAWIGPGGEPSCG